MSIDSLKITFGQAKAEDYLRISIVLKTVYVQTYGKEGVTFEFAKFITHRFSPAYIQQIIEDDPSRLMVAYYKGNPIGVAEIIYDATCPIRKIVLPELSKLYVLHRFLGKGIGYGLLKATEELVLAKGHQKFWLEVYAKNDRAILFYKRQGYQIIGDTQFVMENNSYPNYAMSKDLVEEKLI